MLVLARKVGEKILIGDDIVITVVETFKGKVRIGIDAPKVLKVFREELLKRGGPTREDNAEDRNPQQ